MKEKKKINGQTSREIGSVRFPIHHNFPYSAQTLFLIPLIPLTDLFFLVFFLQMNLSQTIISVAIITSATSEIVKINNGAIFKKIQTETTIYTHSIPIIYTEKIPVDKQQLIETINAAIPNEGKSENTSSQDYETMKVTQQLRNFTLQQLSAAIFELQAELQTNHRRKRAILPIIGDFYQWCCGVATLSDIEDIHKNQEQLSRQYTKLRDAVVEDHKVLLQFDKQVDSLAKIARNTYITITKNIQEIEKTAITRENLKLQITLLLFHYKEIAQKCISHLLPEDSITPQILQTDLKKLEMLLKNQGQHLAIPRENIARYYQLPIAKCQFLKDQIQISVKIPVHSTTQHYELFEPIPIAYQNDDEICQIQIDPTIVIRHKHSNKITQISGHALKSCDTQTQLCKIGDSMWDHNAACVTHLFQNSKIEKINNICYFHCSKAIIDLGTLPRTTNTDYRQFIITNPTTNTMVFDPKTKESTKVNSKGLRHGAFVIQLPCNKQLVEDKDNGKTVIVDRQIPCFKTSANTTVTQNRIIPAQWTLYPPEEVEHGLKTVLAYDERQPTLNKEWKKVTPHIRIKTSGEYERDLENITLQVSTHRIFSSGWYADLLFLILTAILYLLVFILYYVNHIRTVPTAITLTQQIPTLKVNPKFLDQKST